VDGAVIRAFVHKTIETHQELRPPSAVPPSWTSYRADTFDSNENEWTTGDFTDELHSGGKQIRNGAYIWDITSSQVGGKLEVLETAPIADFYLSVDVASISESRAYKQGLMFRGANYGNFYLFALSGEGQYEVFKLQDNQWQLMAGPGSNPAIKVGESNRLGVHSEDGTLAFYINDTLLEEVNGDALLPPGRLGLAAEITQANEEVVLSFDNFQLYTPHNDQLDLLKSAQELAKEGRIGKAQKIYQDISETDYQITAPTWYSLCWWGALWEKADQVMEACDKAVQLASDLEPVHLAISRGNRGIARALTGDFQGAIEDFQAYVDLYKDDGYHQDQVAQREEWIAALEQGRNPFDEETLADLREE
jgi:tetratricopeptide (TPR) repeat protein